MVGILIKYYPRMKKSCLGLSIIFIVIVLSLVNTTDYSMAAKKFERYLRIIGVIPVFYLLVQLKLDIFKMFRISLIISAGVILAVGLYDLMVLNEPFMKGAYYTTLFGYVAVLNAFMLLAVLLTTKLTKVEYTLTIVATIILLNCAIFSQSRASWLGIVVLIILVTLLSIFKLKVKIPAKYVLLLMLIIVSLITINYELIQNRISSGAEDVDSFDVTKVSDRSLAIRLGLWKDSITLFLDSPLLGTGVGDFDYDRNKMIDAGLTPATPSYGHSHNQYLGSLATTGIIGLVGLLIGVFILPFWLFWKIFGDAQNYEIKYFSFMGMIVIIGFACFGMGEVWLARNPTSNIYAVYIAIALAGIVNSKRQLIYEN